MRSSLVAQVANASGLDIEVGGKALFALLPRPRLTIDDVKIHDLTDSVALSTTSVTGDIRLFSLLFGRLEFDHADLYAPDITIDLDRQSYQNFSFLRHLLRTRTLVDIRTGGTLASLSSVTLHNATLRLKSTGPSRPTLIENIHLAANWARAGAPLSIAGRGRWNDLPIDMAAWVSRPDIMLAGTATPISFHANSPAGALALRGNLAGGPDAFLIGNLTASTPLPEKLQDLTGDILPLGTGPISLQTNISASARAVVMTGLKLGINGGQYDGALALRQDGETPVLSGTLATNALQLDPFLVSVPRPTMGNGAWSLQSFEPARIVPVDLDLRLSAGEIAMGKWRAQEAAIAVQLRKGLLNIELAEAAAFGGSLRGHLSMKAGVSGPDVKMRATALGVDMDQWCAAAACGLQMTGKLALDVSLHASGPSFSDMARSLEGSVHASASQGSFSGPDIEQLLRRIEKRPISIALDLRNGRTPYDSASASATVANGMAMITDASITGPATLLQLGGSADINAQTLALSGNAKQTAPDGRARIDGPVLRYSVSGPWRALAVTMDNGQPPPDMPAP